MLDGYYKLRDWDLKTGLPAEKKLRKLGLEFTIKDLKRARKKRG